MLVLALATLAVAYFPRFPYRFASGTLIVCVLGIFMGRKFIADPLIDWLDRCAPALNLALPTGWPGSVLQCWLPEGRWSLLSLLLPLGAILLTMKGSLARLRARYQFGELILPDVPDLVPEAAVESVTTPADPTKPVRIGLTAIEEIVQSRQFLALPLWPRHGWFEGCLWRWLSIREQALAEFVFPNGLSILAPWKRILRNFGVACLAGVVVGFIGRNIGMYVLGAGLFITLCQVIALFFAGGCAFEPVSNSGVNVPRYASFGIGFGELSSLLLKWSAVQFPLLMVFSEVATMLVFLLTGWPIEMGAIFGLKMAGLLFAARFISVALAFSSGTNDTSRVRFRSLLMFAIIVAGGLGFMALAAGSLFVPQQSIAWALWGLAALDAYALFLVYRWFYHTNCFDLVSLPRQ
jgi:hypothetical protein